MSLPFPILVQGTAPRSTLVEQFRTTPNAVLLATSSFCRGSTSSADALELRDHRQAAVTSPGDPVTAARIESIKGRAADPFVEYQVPLAILALFQQGLGRLIVTGPTGGYCHPRSRLRTMGYGRRFFGFAASCPVTQDWRRSSDYSGNYEPGTG